MENSNATRYGADERLGGAALMAVTGRTENKAEIAAALAATPTETAKELREIKRDRAMTEKAWNILAEAGPDAYGGALAALREDTRAGWRQCLADPEERLEPTAAHLREWIDRRWREWFEAPLAALEHRETIREQAFGMAYTSDKLETLARYETRLDRKFERTLAALLRLRELRNMIAGSSGLRS